MIGIVDDIVCRQPVIAAHQPQSNTLLYLIAHTRLYVDVLNGEVLDRRITAVIEKDSRGSLLIGQGCAIPGILNDAHTVSVKGDVVLTVAVECCGISSTEGTPTPIGRT